MKDEQIIKALECCATDDGNDCFQCPYCNIFFESGNGGCVNRCRKDALDLINRQTAENERLKERISYLEESIDCSRKEYNRLLQQTQSEAIKEFAERLKRKIWYSDLCNLERTTTPEIITNLVKEMTEVQE